MSALREWAATLGPAAQAAVAVNAWGKWKTATQVREEEQLGKHQEREGVGWVGVEARVHMRQGLCLTSMRHVPRLIVIDVPLTVLLLPCCVNALTS